MYRRALAASGAAIVLSLVAMSPMFAASATTTQAPVTIAQVQGTGATSPLVGKSVAVRGIVTAVLPGLGGLFVQSQSTASVTGASDAVFVATKHISYSAGDLVDVTGVVGESHKQTQIAAHSVTLVTSAVGLPAAVPLPSTLVGSAREALEGMLVSPTGTYYLDSTDNATGSLTISAGSATPDATNRLVLDDGTNATVKIQPFLLADTAIRPGDTLVASKVPFVLGQSSTGYRLEPLIPLTPSTSLAYKPKFVAATPRLGGAPTLAP